MCKCGGNVSIGEKKDGPSLSIPHLFHFAYYFKLIPIPHPRIGALLLPILRAYLSLAYYFEYVIHIVSLLLAKPSVLHC